MGTSLEGRVVAIIGRGSSLDRAVAAALADAGADIAIATQQPVHEQEFSTASIANEIWAIGREQFSHVLDATDAGAVSAFVEEVRRRLGRCDAIVVSQPEADSASRVYEAVRIARAGTLVLAGAEAAGFTGVQHDSDAETAARVVAVVSGAAR